jgi:lysophospholipase L1-like esterase
LLLLAASMPGQSLLAQNAANTLLSPPETQTAVTRVLQLMESTAVAVPGLVKISDPLRENAQTTATALGKALRDPSPTLEFINEVRAYLALSDTLPRPEFFPPAASQQFLELHDSLQKMELHFQALLIYAKTEASASAGDPNNLKRYAAANSKSLAPTPSLQRYVLIGDSATDLWRLNEYFAGQDFVNRGIAGQTTSQILPRFLADVVALHPFAVVILAGSGDIALDMPPSEMADNLVMMADVARAHSVRPIFASILPASGDAAKTRTPEAIQRMNNWLRDYCIRENLIYIDYYSAMAEPSGTMKADLSDDGLNPNARGYRVMSPLLLDGIERLRTMGSTPEDPKKRRLLPLSK